MSSYNLPNRPETIKKERSLERVPGVFDLEISEVIVTGTSFDDPTGPFHFRLSLVHRQGAIRLDMVPSQTDIDHFSRGMLVVQHRNYTHSNAPGTTPFGARVRPGVTAGDICHYLLNRCELDKYDFTSGMGGCRHWCAVALDHLASAEIVNRNVPELFQGYEQRESAERGITRFPMPRVRGTFYRD